MQVKIKESSIGNNITELVKSNTPILKLQLIRVPKGEIITAS